jgi:hypothetical protein
MAAVEPSAIPLDERLDELYREPPEGFVARRNELVKELRSAGDREAAERVRKLRRPSVAAWLLNRAALESPEQLEEFAEASGELQEAQARALEGTDEAAREWRSAATREAQAVGAVLDSVRAAARDAGHAASDRALELAGETLRAASGDAELREQVLRGRVERERSAATLGMPAVAPTPRGSRSAKRRALAEARRDLERLEAELAAARESEELSQARVDDAQEALRREKGRLAEAKRHRAALDRQLKAAKRRAPD